ncbi:putative transcription factor bHLH family [Helianthus annuus]|uniref:Putative myc-type, basic helix-loop-helix (BHLH) domain-containing protein n=1 Tax=Helianthus annuus TaxID=4232 RepID=A0A251ULG8_HELAN|nr:transcription factor bHLH115 [Helianthus annuus]KAF5804194.1 putative transcription factor bHLH family [Helianthus annuus]KAJ0568858.1 putative transcription factor bHLH family [Helianthus annuus]KAJ0575183.1 putative transcription factor bHLH family [Helianthus annuus]KAJ0583140.1 putative transcription factor bHLH family [Helianthus annuus]KAJ0745881.1 putative transcription factor bHLH family [Helianthus annuus]
MAAPAESDNSNCFFDFSLIEQFSVPGGELPSLEPEFQWSSDPFSEHSKGFADTYGKLNVPKEDESRKRANPGSCSDSKACREKKRRDKLNDRFQELNEILDPGRSTKTDKTVILADAIRMVTQLRNEAAKLKDSSEDLLVKINELKVEKNELRDEKQKLKSEKEKLEQQLKAACCHPPPPAFYPPVMPVPCPGPPPPVGGNKFVPFMGYQGVPMWQFASPAAVDTSKDHVLRSPLA